MCQAKHPAESFHDPAVRSADQPQAGHPAQPDVLRAPSAQTMHPPPQRCGCSGSHAGADATPARALPDVPQPSLLILAAVGEASLRGLVRRHHDLLRASDIGGMFPADDAQFDAAVAHIADFVVESCGGPARYSRQRQAEHEARPQEDRQQQREGVKNGCLRSRHMPFSIDLAGRETWLGCLWQALQESGYPPAVREEYWNWSEPLSVRMVSRIGAGTEPRRYPYDSVQFRIRHPAFAMCRR